jgi:nitroreductase
MTLLLAASAAGWAGTWLSEWLAFDADVAALLDLGPDERVAGFIYLGTASCEPPERPRPDMLAKISRWQK